MRSMHLIPSVWNIAVFAIHSRENALSNKKLTMMRFTNLSLLLPHSLKPIKEYDTEFPVECEDYLSVQLKLLL